MGIFDKAKQMLGENRDKIDQVVDKAGDIVDERTGGRHADKVDQAQDFAKGQADRHFGEAGPERPSTETDENSTEGPRHG